jgi:mRNA (2'-O-methyladenosine-N6-)-methyltransferase
MEFCPHGTKVECTKVNSAEPCKKLHFKKIIQKHTDESLGDCSFLNTCFHMDTCKYVLLNFRAGIIITRCSAHTAVWADLV